MKINLFGNTLLVTAALLYAAHNIAAAIYAGPNGSFADAYRGMGIGLELWTWLTLIIGFLSVTWDFWPRFWKYVTTPMMEDDLPAGSAPRE